MAKVHVCSSGTMYFLNFLKDFSLNTITYHKHCRRAFESRVEGQSDLSVGSDTIYWDPDVKGFSMPLLKPHVNFHL